MEHEQIIINIEPDGTELWCAIRKDNITEEFFQIKSFAKSCAHINDKYPELMSEYISQYRKYFNIETSTLTHDGYEYIAKDILKKIPKPIADKLNGIAYDQGHSAGYDEVLNILNGLMWDFKDIFEKYKLVNKETGETV